MEYFAAYNNKMYYYQIKECCGTYQKGGNCFTLNRVTKRARQLHNQVGLWRKVAWFVLLRSELQHEAKGWTPLLRQIPKDLSCFWSIHDYSKYFGKLLTQLWSLYVKYERTCPCNGGGPFIDGWMLQNYQQRACRAFRPDRQGRHIGTNDTAMPSTA